MKRHKRKPGYLPATHYVETHQNGLPSWLPLLTHLKPKETQAKSRLGALVSLSPISNSHARCMTPRQAHSKPPPLGQAELVTMPHLLQTPSQCRVINCCNVPNPTLNPKASRTHLLLGPPTPRSKITKIWTIMVIGRHKIDNAGRHHAKNPKHNHQGAVVLTVTAVDLPRNKGVSMGHSVRTGLSSPAHRSQAMQEERLRGS
mmetsp:Transcript_128819/g.222571  ORF Transcript_128819/g.222571 Transcript_128819/m.222571 type:complete len:202 (+) Transcript_128819:791-1396(+)